MAMSKAKDKSLFEEFMKWKEAQAKKSTDTSSDEDSSSNEANESSRDEIKATEETIMDEVKATVECSMDEVKASDKSSSDKSSSDKVEATEKSTPSTSSTVGSSSADYSAADYLMKRGKGGKYSGAAKDFHHILKVAAKEAQIWDAKTSLRDVSPAQRKHIHAKVISECPSLKGHTREMDAALGRALANLKYYERQKKKKGPKRVGEKKSGLSKKKSDTTKLGRKTSGGQSSSSSESIKPHVGDDIVIVHDGKDIAMGTFIAPDDKEMYCRIKFRRHLCDEPDQNVDLPEAVGKKIHIWQLQENDVFLWKMEKIKKVRRSRGRNPKYNDYNDI